MRPAHPRKGSGQAPLRQGREKRPATVTRPSRDRGTQSALTTLNSRNVRNIRRVASIGENCGERQR